jgi:cytoskeletal protein RodZ
VHAEAVATIAVKVAIIAKNVKAEAVHAATIAVRVAKSHGATVAADKKRLKTELYTPDRFI